MQISNTKGNIVDKFLLNSILTLIIGILSNVVATWIVPKLNNQKKITIIIFVIASTYSFLYLNGREYRFSFTYPFISGLSDNAVIKGAWEKEKAFKIMRDSLKEHQIQGLEYRIINIFGLQVNEIEKMIGVAYRDIVGHSEYNQSEVLTIFEFTHIDYGWAIESVDYDAIECGYRSNLPDQINVLPIGFNQYAVSIEESFCMSGQCRGGIAFYSKVGGKYREIFRLITFDRTERYSREAKIKLMQEGRSYYDIQVTGWNLENDAKITKIKDYRLFKFNGDKYVESNSFK